MHMLASTGKADRCCLQSSTCRSQRGPHRKAVPLNGACQSTVNTDTLVGCSAHHASAANSAGRQAVITSAQAKAGARPAPHAGRSARGPAHQRLPRARRGPRPPPPPPAAARPRGRGTPPRARRAARPPLRARRLPRQRAPLRLSRRLPGLRHRQPLLQAKQRPVSHSPPAAPSAPHAARCGPALTQAAGRRAGSYRRESQSACRGGARLCRPPPG